MNLPEFNQSLEFKDEWNKYVILCKSRGKWNDAREAVATEFLSKLTAQQAYDSLRLSNENDWITLYVPREQNIKRGGNNKRDSGGRIGENKTGNNYQDLEIPI